MIENCPGAKSKLFLISLREKRQLLNKNRSFSQWDILGQLILESKTAEMYLEINYI